MDSLLNCDSKKIIITNNVAETNKYLRNTVKNEAAVFYNFDVVSLLQIAKELFFAYGAMYSPGKRWYVVKPGVAQVRMLMALKKVSYRLFSEKSKDLGSVTEILRVLNEIRMNAPSDYFFNSEDIRISELRRMLSDYEKALTDNNELDEVMLYGECLKILNNINNLDILLPLYTHADFVNMYYGRMSFLEKQFLEALLTKLGKNPEDIKTDIFLSNNKTASTALFMKAYGVFNEVDSVKRQIVEKGYKLGQVAIIYPSPEYERCLMAVLDEAGITYTFPKGFSANSTLYIQLMISLIEFAKADFDARLLEAVIDNTDFILKEKRKKYRRFIDERVGFRRERYADFIDRYQKKSEDDDFTDFINAVITCFDPEKSCGQIFSELVKLVNLYTDNQNLFRMYLKEDLQDEIKTLSLLDSKNFEESLDIILDYLKNLRCKMPEYPGAVSLLPFGKEIVIDREYLYVLGLSNENIAGTLVESPVLCDDELVKCTGAKVNLQMEANKRKREAFERTLKNNASREIIYSYSYYDTVSLLTCSPSLLYLDKLEEAGMTEKEVKAAKYRIDVSARTIDVTSINAINKDVSSEEIYTKREVQCPWSFSASSLQEMLKCPLEYYYAHILHVPSVEHIDRVADRWLPAHKKGNVFHHTLENYVNEAIITNKNHDFDEAVFNKCFDGEIRNAVKENPVPSQVIFEEEKEEAKAVILRYIRALLNELNDSDKQIIGCEVDFADVIYKDSNFELSFRGSVDRLDGQVDENGVLQLDIIDYKTGTSSHKKAEIDAGVQIQHYVYPIAMLDWAVKNKTALEKQFNVKINDVNIRNVKYVFPYDEEIGEIDVTEDVKATDFKLPQGITDILTILVGLPQQGQKEKALSFATEASMYSKENNREFCTYCKYTKVCRCWL